MKQIDLLFLFLLAINSLNAQNRLTVNNQTGQAAQFSDLQTAIDAAENGDIIYLQGSDQNYGEILVNKSITIYGTGYFLVENEDTQAYLHASSISKIVVNTAGSDSSFYGLDLTDTSNSIRLEGANNVIINGCTFHRAALTANAQNAIFQSCFLTYAAFGISSLNLSENASAAVSNCIFVGNKNISLSDEAEVSVSQSFFLNGDFIMVENSTFTNNIFADTNFSSGFLLNNNFQNNAFVANINLPNNLNNIPLNTLISGDSSADNPVDNVFLLPQNSPANPDNNLETALGPFGGNMPYVLSGIPPIPHTYELVAPTTVNANGTMNVVIKAKVGN